MKLFPLLFIACALLGQTIEVKSLFQPASLSGNWKHHDGDDPRWADPAFDDSAWAREPMPESVRLPRTQRAWYRVRVALPEPMPQERLSVLIGSFGNGFAYEVFLNGQRVGAEGNPAGGLWELRLPRVSTFEVPGHPRHLLIALRLRSVFVPYSSIAGRGRDESWIGTRTAIASRVEAWHAGRVQQMLPLLLMASAIAMSALFFLLLPLWRRDSPEFFWFGLLQLAGLLTRVPVAYPEGLGFARSFTVCLVVMASGWVVLVAWAALLRALFFSGPSPGAWRVTLVACLIQFLPPAGLVLGVPTSVALSSAMNLSVTLATVLVYVELGWRQARPPFPMPAIHAAICLYLASSFAAFAGNLVLPSDTVFLSGVFTRTATLLLFSFAIAILLNQRSAKLLGERQRLGQEMAAAAGVQSLLLTARSVQEGSYAIHPVYLPAAEVGGDFYQVRECDDGSRLVLVGDVSGKGLEAAMVASVAVGAFRATDSRSPAALLAALNLALTGNGRPGFVTCCCARFDPGGQAVFANAGHPAPYCDGAEIDIDAGLPLGVVPGVTYTELSIPIKPETQVTFVSDGVVEAANSPGELFGFERTREISTRRAQEIAEAAKAWGQNDDITVVTVRRTT